MKRVTFGLVIVLLVTFTAPAVADVGNNPNSFELDMNCGGQTIHATIPVINGEGAKIDDGRVAVSRTHYIDFTFNGEFEEDELVASRLNGRGIQTTWCTWTWDNDPFLHGMDIQFLPPN